MKKEEKKLKPFSTKKITIEELDDIWFGKFGFKDENKNIVIEAQYDSCGEFSCGLCPVAYQSWYHTPEGKRYYEMHWGYIDQSGKERIPFKYRDARNFNKYGIAAVQDEYGENYYLIDSRGRKVFGGKDIDVDRLYREEDRFLEFTKGEDTIWEDNVGVYDTKKRKVFLEPHTCGILEWSEDVIEVFERGKVCPADFWEHYINAEGEELYPGLIGKGFNIIEKPNKSGFVIVGIFEFIEADRMKGNCYGGDKYYCRTDHYGVANLDGVLVIPAEYDRIYEKKNGVFVCTKDGKDEYYKIRRGLPIMVQPQAMENNKQ